MKKILWATLILTAFFGARADAQNSNAPAPGSPTTAAAAPGSTPAPQRAQEARRHIRFRLHGHTDRVGGPVWHER